MEKVQDATGQMLQRADSIESDLNGLMSELRSTVQSVVSNLRDGAGSLSSELEALRGNLKVISADTATGPVDSEPEVVEEVEDETTAEAAFEAAPEEDLAEETAVEAPADEVEQELAEEEAEEVEIAEEVEGEPEAEAEVAEEEAPAADEEGAEGARLIALNMALNGTPREETARYLDENFDLRNADAILDEVYARVGG